MSFIGIDVAKAQLEFADRPSGERGAVPNDEDGIRALVAHGQAATLVVCEATGGYEAPLVAALATAGLPVVVANPRQVRDFAKARGSWPRPMRLMPRSSRCSPSACGPHPARCQMRPSRRSTRSSRAVASWSRCSPPSGIACSSPGPPSDAISSSTSASWSAASARPMTISTPP